MEFLANYGLFLAQAVTIVVAIAAVLILAIGLGSKGKSSEGHLEVTNLSELLSESKAGLQQSILSKAQLKALNKAKKKDKKEQKEHDDKNNVFVIDFNGSTDAHQVEAMRREITAIVQIAEKGDEVILRLESPGGMVHSYGLAASQLKRLTSRGIILTVTVDKVAASGGYMMACIANKIVAAPFAVIGSIGVIAQIPNFSKILKKNDVEFEQITAGQYKRTLTIFGENTNEDRAKFQQEIDDVHELFKQHVSNNRPQLDMAKIATGETWYGEQAITRGLVDELSTSDDYILSAMSDKTVYLFKYAVPKTLSEKFGKVASASVENSLTAVWQKMANWRAF